MEQQLTTVTRGYKHKVNLGGYESCDIWCSQSIECEVERKDEVSKAIYKWCKSEVVKDIPEAKAEGRKIQKQ